jgi:hypothetical protein
VVTLIVGLCFLDSEGLSVYAMSPLQVRSHQPALHPARGGLLSLRVLGWLTADFVDNMVTSSPPALGLACEPAEAGMMQRRPQGRESVLLNKVRRSSKLDDLPAQV